MFKKKKIVETNACFVNLHDRIVWNNRVYIVTSVSRYFDNSIGFGLRNASDNETYLEVVDIAPLTYITKIK